MVPYLDELRNGRLGHRVTNLRKRMVKFTFIVAASIGFIVQILTSVLVERRGKMLIKVIVDSVGESPEVTIHRTVNSFNIRKVAKSIHVLFPDTNYATLEALIWNGWQKRVPIVILRPPKKNAPLSQLAEENDLKSLKSGFESQEGHQS